jgi:small-conductance mechanosensitive channel
MAEAHVDFFTGFAAFWPALLVSRPTISITVDIFLFVLAAVIWMVLEARRLQMRWVWLYVLFAIVIAVSVTFPLFLAARERKLAALGATDTEPAPALRDKLGLTLLGVGTLIFSVYCTLR